MSDSMYAPVWRIGYKAMQVFDIHDIACPVGMQMLIVNVTDKVVVVMPHPDEKVKAPDSVRYEYDVMTGLPMPGNTFVYPSQLILLL